MRVICIDGKPIIAPKRVRPLPEFVPLSAHESADDSNYYCVEGHDETIDGHPLEWHKRRFMPLSEIPESEEIDEQEFEAIIYQRV